MPHKPTPSGLGALVNGHYVLGKVFDAIEDVILRHEGVDRCCVVPHGMVKKGRWLYALILAKPGHVANEQMMVELLNKLLAEDAFEDYELPNRWRAVKWLPEAPNNVVVRNWLRKRKSFSRFYAPGKQAPFRGEKDWEASNLSLHLQDPLNFIHFEGALSRVQYTKFFGQNVIYFDLRHKIKKLEGRLKGANSYQNFCARFYSTDPAFMRRIEKTDRGAHVVVRARCTALKTGGGPDRPMLTMLEVTEMEVRSDFRRTNLDSTDQVFERAL